MTQSIGLFRMWSEADGSSDVGWVNAQWGGPARRKSPDVLHPDRPVSPPETLRQPVGLGGGIGTWNNVGDRTGISILKLLRHIGVDHEVHLQWIPSHVDIYGNEVVDNLAKQGTAEPLCSTPSLTFDEIYSIRKNKDLKTWRVPPSHDWYKRSSPGGSIGLACDRADQTALSRFVSGHLRSCSFSQGNKEVFRSAQSVE
ncbi:hypothetical protein AVEN_108158-1 [Araneus ventricosus]|uniref:RNase H type-1 domain-containing protein n=1 Tax=Araneus ventricosus TaxID=182803 RepID=A0A4Y2TKH0_ARAVE|nr:hypothetical protein AVEN_108158-1 [Araneus ventricosus]